MINTRTIVLLGFILILAGIELDIFLPTLPIMQRELKATDAEMTWIVSINLLGFSLSTFFYGFFSDSIGRRPILLLGLFLFFCGSLGCGLASTLASLLWARFIQGIGCGAPLTVCFTMILDMTENRNRAAAYISLFNSLLTGATTLAPIVGAYVGERHSWQANFLLLTIGSLLALLLAWFFLKESLPSPTRWLWKEVWNDYLFVLRSKKVWHLGMIPILMYSALLIYLVNFPLAVSSSLMDIRAIGYLQACIMLSFVLGSIIASYLIPRLNFYIISKIAYLLACGGGLLLLLGSYMVPQSWNILTLFMGLVAAGSAFIIGLYMGESLNVFPKMRGISTAVQGALRLSFSSVMIFLSGFLINHHFSYVILLIYLCIFGSLCLSLINKEAPERS